MEFFDQMVYWHWWIAAAVFIAIEMLDGSAHFIWMAVSAVVVGILTMLIPMNWRLQFLLFSIFTVASIYGWKAYKRANPDVDQFPTLNQRGANYVDRHFTLSEPIVDGVGKVKVDDTIWKVRGPDMAAGSKIKVTAVDGTSFVVESI